MHSPFRPQRLLLGLFLLGLALGGSLPASAAPAVRIKSWPIPSPGSEPIEIALGPDGNQWFTEQNASRVARITPRGVITEFPLPTFGFPKDITAGPDGNVWFTEGSNGRIARITPTGQIREVVFSDFDNAGGITTGPDGNIWFTDSTGNKVWRFTIATRTLTDFPVPTPDSFPGDITSGPDGNLWFLEQSAGKMARITTEGQITEFPEPLSLPFAITAGPDGNVWFTERFQRIGKVTPAGQFTFYTTTLHTLESIIEGPDGNLWFTSFGDDRVASITTDGVVTPMPVVPGSGPTGISTDARGRIWFLGYESNRVYRMTL
ncbi:N/A [soil metagenome]